MVVRIHFSSSKFAILDQGHDGADFPSGSWTESCLLTNLRLSPMFNVLLLVILIGVFLNLLAALPAEKQTRTLNMKAMLGLVAVIFIILGTWNAYRLPIEVY